MDTWVWIVIAAAAAALLVILVAAMARRRRTEHLRERFGPEYERVTAEDRKAGEKELHEREERADELQLKPLSPIARDRYLDEWRTAQARFVDDPEGAVSAADGIVRRMLAERGYHADDRDRLVADVSAHHPETVQRYRHGHELATADDDDGDRTERLREAMTDFRAVLEEMLEDATARERVET